MCKKKEEKCELRDKDKHEKSRTNQSHTHKAVNKTDKTRIPFFPILFAVAKASSTAIRSTSTNGFSSMLNVSSGSTKVATSDVTWLGDSRDTFHCEWVEGDDDEDEEEDDAAACVPGHRH